MSISRHAGNPGAAPVVSPETLYETVKELGIVPFFENGIPGFSIEERTPKEFWFDEGDELGPWDWKIHAVQSGDIAYGKFLQGKSAFATVQWYRELMNWRRSQPKYAPEGPVRQAYEILQKAGSISSRELRKALGLKKNQTDALLTKLQMDCLVVTGDIQRVYRGADLTYVGWQLASFCTPDSLFGAMNGEEEEEDFAAIFGIGAPKAASALSCACSPAESFDRLFNHIRSVAPSATDAQIRKLIG